MAWEEKKGGKAIFPWFLEGFFHGSGVQAVPRRKNHLEKPIFPGLGWPGAGSSGSRQGLGWFWEYLEPKSREGRPGPVPEPWNERELLQSGIFPKIPILDPWSRDGGDFFWGENPKSSALEQLGAGNESR